MYGPNRIHLSNGIELKRKVQDHKYTQVATQTVSNKALALTKVNTSREKTLNGIVTEVEATKEDVAIKRNLCLILKQVIIKEYPEVDIEMYGSFAR